jgi:tetratricopeptide (TPR) repeat protein
MCNIKSPLDTPKALSQKGYVCYKKGKLAQAICCLNRAIQIDPYCPAFYNNRGDVYVRMRKFDKAIADYSKVLRMGTEDLKVFCNVLRKRGTLYKKLKQHDKAKRDFIKAGILGGDNRENSDYYDKALYRQIYDALICSEKNIHPRKFFQSIAL